MASVTPKIRSRKDGAAIALDDFDKRLLNAMQGGFPIEPRPYAAVAAALEVPEERVLARVGELVDERIIRQITPIFDTRALGYGSMLVAAKVDPEHPWRAARIINSHPGVSHNYLRNHEFNMWFTLAVEEDSALGLDGTLDVLQELTGAESIRQLPTLKLFKIRMDLELVGGTDELAKSAVAEDPIELEKQPYDELDRAVIRATQGDLPVVAEPYTAAAAQLGMSVDALVDHLRAMVDRGLLRRVAAILFHRRAGFSANGMGVWQVPDEHIAAVGPRMAAYRGISHCYQRPTYADWPYSIFTMAHGRSKEECDAILDAIAADNPEIQDRATLYSSTEFKKIRLLYFTEDFKRWEREHALDGGLAHRHPLQPSSTPARCSACPEASTRRCARWAPSGATRSSSSAGTGPSSSTSTATTTSTTCARGGRSSMATRTPRSSPRSSPPPSAGRRSARRPRARSTWPRRSPGGCRRSRWCA